MTDVAELGFKVDSSQAVSATKNLDKMTEASQRSAKAAQTFNQQNAANTKIALSFAQSLQVTSGLSDALNDELEKLNKTHGSLKPAFKALSDVLNVTGIQMGGAALQAGRLAGATSHLGPVLTGVTFGLTAMATAAIGAFKAMSSLAVLADTSKFSGFSAAFGQGLAGALGRQGAGTDQILQDMQSFGFQVRQAQMGVGELAAEFRKVGVSVTDSDDALLKVSAIMQTLTSDVDKMRLLQIAGLSATRENLNLLSQGPAAVEAQIQATRKSTDAQIAESRRVEAAWNAMWNNFVTFAKTAAVSVGSVFSKIASQTGDQMMQSVQSGYDKAMRARQAGTPGTFENRFFPASRLPAATAPPIPNILISKPPAAPTGETAEQEIARLTRLNTSISLLGDLADSSQRAAQKQNELRIAFLQTGASAGNLQKVLIDQARVQEDGVIIQQKLANGLIDSSDASVLYTQKQHELAIQVAAGRLTQEDMNKALENYKRHAQDAADASAQYASKLPNLTRMGQEFASLDKQFDQFATGALNSASSNLLDFLDHTKSGADAFRDFSRAIVRGIEEMIIKMVILAPIAKALSGIFGGAGGVSGGLSGLFTSRHSGGLIGGAGPMRSVNPLVFAGAPRMHSGGLLPDEIPIIAQRGERVIPRGQKFSGGDVNLEVQINNTMSDQAKVSARTEPGPTGRRMIIEVVKQAQAGGEFNDINQKQFGLRRQKVR